jgi:UDP-N-acetyl-D-glucosamine dehydrogenase
MNYQHILKNKIASKESVICVVGLGYVGSELLKKFNYEGFKTIGIDINLNRVKKLFNKKKIFLTDNYKHVNRADIIILALPTPLKKNLEPDLSCIKNSMSSMKNYLKKGQLISLESSSFPGTTEKLIAGEIIKKDFNLSKDFFLIYSPERISPELKVKSSKKIKYQLFNTPKICAGYSNRCLELGSILYKNITTKVVKSKSLKSAETSKMVENIFRSVNIALVNELKMFLNKINIDIDEVLDLAGTKPFGFTSFSPGPGFGGHCIPIDPFYLYWLAKQNNFNLKFIKTAGEINRKVTSWITNKILSVIKKNKIKLIRKKILILGVAYKRNIDDTRESPGLIIANKLKKFGFDFDYSDPHVKKIYFDGIIKKSIELNKFIFRKYPVVVLVTDHLNFDYKLISREAKYIFDSRNVIKNRTKNYFKV